MKRVTILIVGILSLVGVLVYMDELSSRTPENEIYVVTLMDECGKEYYRDTVKEYDFTNFRFKYSKGDSSMNLPTNNLILKTVER